MVTVAGKYITIPTMYISAQYAGIGAGSHRLLIYESHVPSAFLLLGETSVGQRNRLIHKISQPLR
jgi:hypothetical protein